MRIWGALPLSDRPPPAPPILGYRGCTLQNIEGAEWWAFGGFVTFRGEEGAETRRDQGKLFENRLLVAAPPEVQELVELRKE